MQLLLTSGKFLRIIPPTKVANFVYSTYHFARLSSSWDLPPYLPNEGRIYTAIRRCLILPPHSDAGVSPCGYLSLRRWGPEGGGVTLYLSGHGTGLKGVGAPSLPQVAQGNGGVPGLSFNTVCNQKNEGERNAIKRKQVLPSWAGRWVNKLCL